MPNLPIKWIKEKLDRLEKSNPLSIWQMVAKIQVLMNGVGDTQPLTIVTKCSILDVAAVLDPPLLQIQIKSEKCINCK